MLDLGEAVDPMSILRLPHVSVRAAVDANEKSNLTEFGYY